jgi:hypothetical protein
MFATTENGVNSWRIKLIKIEKVDGERYVKVESDPLDSRDHIEIKTPSAHAMQVPIDKQIAVLMIQALSEYIAIQDIERPKRKRIPVTIDSQVSVLSSDVTLMAPKARALQTALSKDKRQSLNVKDLKRPIPDTKEVAGYTVGGTVNLALDKAQQFTVNLAKTICSTVGSNFGSLCDQSTRVKCIKVKVKGDSLDECVRKAASDIRVASHELKEGIGRMALTNFLRKHEVHFRTVHLKNNNQSYVLALELYYKPIKKKVKNGNSKI